MPPAKDFGESDEEAEKRPNVANHLKRVQRRGPSQTEVEDHTPKGACMYICSRERPGERGYWRIGCKGLSYVAFQDLEFKRPSLSPVHGEIPNSYYHYLDIIFFKRQRRATYSKYTELMVAQVMKSALYMYIQYIPCHFVEPVHTSSTMSLPSPCR